MPFDGLDGSLIATFGEDVTYTPNGGTPEDVRVIRNDPDALSAAGTLMTLFGTIADSGFSQAPAKNDTFTVDEAEYRAIDVQGPDVIGGYRISLDRR